MMFREWLMRFWKKIVRIVDESLDFLSRVAVQKMDTRGATADTRWSYEVNPLCYCVRGNCTTPIQRSTSAENTFFLNSYDSIPVGRGRPPVRVSVLYECVGGSCYDCPIFTSRTTVRLRGYRVSSASVSKLPSLSVLISKGCANG